MTELDLEVQYASGDADAPSREQFEAWIGAALEGRRESAELCVRVVDEAEGRDLNRRYRDHDYATNVLSFPVDLPAGVDSAEIGDIVICAPVVRSEAAGQGKDLLAHWAHLAVHGTLHLLGYDHQDEHEAGAMEALETRVLADLGFPDPYAADKLVNQ